MVYVLFSSNKSGGGFGMFSMFKNLVGSKALTAEDLSPVLEKMKDHLISMYNQYLLQLFIFLLSLALAWQQSWSFMLSHCTTFLA